jgi:soluble lytic murein transglycosylase-like protein
MCKFDFKSLSLALMAGLLLSSLAQADVYRFVDEEGVVHFTNLPNDPRYKPVDPPKKPAAKKANSKWARKVKSGKIKRRIVDTYDEHIQEASQRFNIPQALVKAVIVIESNCDSKAISHAGAQGLMQLMPRTAAEMGVKDVFNPRQNILGGTRYLRYLANSYDGDLVLTLASYNAGQNAVNRHMDIPPIAETQRYVRRVLQLYFHFKKTATGEPGRPAD